MPDDYSEHLEEGALTFELRGRKISIPAISEFVTCGIKLADPPRINVFELCRWLAETHREEILASEEEQRISVLPAMQKILQLDIARPNPPNTHWSNWPGGGSL